MAERPGPLLRVRNLWVDRLQGPSLLRGVSFEVSEGESLALVGPSGCGKSLTARALIGLLPAGLRGRGSIQWRGAELTAETWGAVRGVGIGLILQEPMTSLNPVLSVGAQVAETLRVHQGLSRSAAWSGAVQLLSETRIPDPERVVHQYAHQLSGGMRQRVLLAAALACDPELLIADEATTALDVLVQREILALIRDIQSRRKMALLFITHDVNLVPLVANKVATMADGRITEVVAVTDLDFSRPRCLAPSAPVAAKPVLVAKKVRVWHEGALQPAVAGVDLELLPGRAVGLLGESGCGKTTLGRALSLQHRPQRGTVRLGGEDCLSTRGSVLRSQRRQIQMLFQDPGGSLNARQRVDAALKEAAGMPACDPVALLVEVGLDPAIGSCFPHQLSGGQRQRVALARCLAASPAVLIADEPTSALDAAAQDQVLELLAKVMRERSLALLLISHDLEVLQRLCHQIHVMYAGLVVEVLPVVENPAPRHPYTIELFRSVPRNLRQNPGDSAAGPLSFADAQTGSGQGCPYQANCARRKASCAKELPPLERLSSDWFLRCPVTAMDDCSQFIDTL